jgi:anti-anti-sigma factor
MAGAVSGGTPGALTGAAAWPTSGGPVRNAQSTFAVDVRPDGATVVVVLGGELDMTSSPLLLTVIEQALATRREPPCSHLVVDMSGVRFADASGISPLLLARAMLAKRSGTVELRRCRRSVLRLVRVLDLEDMLAPEETAPPVG